MKHETLGLKLNDIYSKYNIPLLSIFILGLLLRLIFFSGMGISDSLVYSNTANDLNNGKGIDPDSVLTLSTRIGLVYATSLSYIIFGINDFSATFFVLLTSLGSIILAYHFGKLLFDRKVGLTAAFLLSIFPLDIVYSTQLLSDIPSSFFMALGVFFFLKAEYQKGLNYGFSYILSGIFIGIGYLFRESILLIAIFFIFYVAVSKKIKWSHFLVPIGIAIIFILELSVFYHLTSDPFYRSHSSQKYLADAVGQQNYFGRLDFPLGLLHYPWLFATNSLLNVFYFLVAISAIFAMKFKKKNVNTLLMWLIPVGLYLSFGTSSLMQYIPFRAVDRYTSIITIPAILLVSFFFVEKKYLMNKKVIPLMMILLLVYSVISVYSHGNRNLLVNLKDSYDFLEGTQKKVFTDERSLKAMGYISGYNINLNLNEYPSNLEGLEDTYILINRNMIKNLKEAYSELEFPNQIFYPPSEWEFILDFGKVEEDKVIIYYIPDKNA
jgi:hypothetical protein